MAQGVSGSMYEKRLVAWAFLSQILQSNVNKARFHRTTSPRRCWADIVDWYDTKTNAQKGMCMRELYNFKIGNEDNPVEKLYAIEDLREKLVHAGMSADDNTLYSCSLNAHPTAEDAFEIWGLNLKQVYDRKDILNRIRSQYEALLPTCGKSKGWSNSHALIGNGGRGHGGGGGRGHGGGRFGKGKEGGNSNKNAGAETSKVTCFRCRAKGHFSNKCNTKICEKCGGRGHEISKCASPADMDESPAEAVLAMVEDSGDDAVETTSF